jgi:hypothetical protein
MGTCLKHSRRLKANSKDCAVRCEGGMLGVDSTQTVQA